MERGERSERGADDGDYPPAPVPSHERAWRHPSEVGQAQWAATEPPLVIGKGVMVATGTVGAVLGVAVLWMLIPAGLPSAPAAAPAVSQSMQSIRDPSSPSTFVAPPTTDTPPTASSVRSTTTAPTGPAPANTLHVVRDDTIDPAAAPPAAIAVTVGDVTMLITTAAAVKGGAAGDPVTLNDAGNEVHPATVAQTMGEMVVLATAASTTETLEATAFTAIAAAEPDQPVLVLSSEPIEVPYVADGEPLDLAAVATAEAVEEVVEGTPVVDETGALVALCTRRVDGAGIVEIALVPVADLLLGGVDPDTATSSSTPDTTVSATTLLPTPSEPAAWLGVLLGPDDGRVGALVMAVVPDSPAQLAGLTAGARITAVDGRSVDGHEALLSIVRESAPGQTLELTVAVPNSAGAETTRTLSVLLAAAAPSA